MTSDNLVSVKRLHKFYGPIHAVRGVDFELERGEVLGFLGPNGAGKTTTMQLICGALAPTSGQVHIGGIDVLDQPKQAKALLGYLPERPPLYRELTVDEYLRYCARLRGLAAAECRSAATKAKQRCGLADTGGRLIGNLSKGFQQRVGIAQAIIHSPAVVVLDEPTAGLDPIQIREIRSLIRELGEDHGVILSTHILPEVQALCDRVQVIHQGRLVLDKSMAELTARGLQSSLRVVLNNPPQIEEITKATGAERVETLTDCEFRVFCRESEAFAEAFALVAVENGWGLRELRPEQHSLEEIFVQLTCAEEPNPDATTHPVDVA